MAWDTAKLKYVTRFRYGDALPPELPDHGEYRVFGSNGPYASCSVANTRCPAIVIGRKGSYGKINWSSDSCFASDTTFFVDSSVCAHNLRWLYWLLKTLKLDQGTDEAAVPGLNREAAYSLDVRVPPPAEQRAIADYLDRVTGHLDALVVEKERLLNLLQEKRQALLTRAVTRGLNADGPFRDSGSAWLGDIPAQWQSRKIAWLFRERDQRGYPELPLLEVSLNSGVVQREFTGEKIESTASDFNSYKVARKGDLVFNKMRMWQGAVGVAPLDGLVSPDYVVAEPSGELSSAYAGLLFKTPAFSAECARRSHGIVWDRLRLYWDGFREIEVPLPARSQQATIVDHIRDETRKIDELISVTRNAIALLEERRTAVIAASITGQIDMEGSHEGD